MSSEKEAGLGISQLGLRFLAVSNSWNGNVMSNFTTVRQMLKNTEPAGSHNVLAQLCVLLFSWVKNKI